MMMMMMMIMMMMMMMMMMMNKHMVDDAFVMTYPVSIPQILLIYHTNQPFMYVLILWH